MGRDERGGTTTRSVAPRPTRPVRRGLSFARIEPLSPRAGGAWGTAIIRPRGLLATDVLLVDACRELDRRSIRGGFVSFDVTRADLERRGQAEALLHDVWLAGRSATSMVVQVPHEAVALASRCATENLRRFRAAGARVFLAGLSSHRHLATVDRFPVDGVTIAATATVPARDTGLVEAVVEVARAAGVHTMALGAGTARRRCLLADLGVDHAQHPPS